jgi:peptide/nickel transport system substrate-binding protein
MKRVWRIGVLLGLLSCIVWSSAQDDELVIAFQGGAVTIDPHGRNETTTLGWQRHIFEPLTFFAPDGSLIPVLATGWENIDDLTWHVDIRSGVLFHDGTTMTPEDVVFSMIRAAQDPNSQMRGGIGQVAEANVLDEDTIEVITNSPDPLLPRNLERVAVIPKALFEAQGVDTFLQNPIGTGPYTYVSWLTGDNLVLEAFPNYWGEQPDFQNVRLVNIPNGATRVAALLSGEVDIAEKVLPQDFERVNNSGVATISQTPGQRVIYLTMDYGREVSSAGMAEGEPNPFIDPRVRQAVYQAINVDAIVSRVMGGAATVASQFDPVTNEGYNPSIERLPYDVEAARALLEEAGVETPVRLRLDAPNDRYLNDALIAQAVAGMLADIGFEIEVNTTPRAVFFPQLNDYDFTMFLAGWGSSNTVQSMRNLMHTRDEEAGLGGSNRIRHGNPEVDALIAAAGSAFDPAERQQILWNALELAQQQGFAYIPLHYENVIAGVSNDVDYRARYNEYIFAAEVSRK